MTLTVPSPLVDEYSEGVDDIDDRVEIRDRFVADQWKAAVACYGGLSPRDLAITRGTLQGELTKRETDHHAATNRLRCVLTLRRIRGLARPEGGRRRFVVRGTPGVPAAGGVQEVLWFRMPWHSDQTPSDDDVNLLLFERKGTPQHLFDDPNQGPVPLEEWLAGWLAELAPGSSPELSEFDSVTAQAEAELKVEALCSETGVGQTNMKLGLLSAVESLKASALSLDPNKSPFARIVEADIQQRRVERRAELLEGDGDFVLAVAGRLIQREGLTARAAYERMASELLEVQPGARPKYGSVRGLTDAMRRRRDQWKMSAVEAQDRGDELAKRLPREHRRLL